MRKTTETLIAEARDLKPNPDLDGFSTSDGRSAWLACWQAARRLCLDLAEALAAQHREWLCERCNVIHPPQPGGTFLHPCPDCKTAMLPTSPELREIASLRQRLSVAEGALRSAAGGDPRAAVEADPSTFIERMLKKLDPLDREAFNFCMRQARAAQRDATG